MRRIFSTGTGKHQVNACGDVFFKPSAFSYHIVPFDKKFLQWRFWLPIGDVEKESWRAPDGPLEFHASRPLGGEEVTHVVSVMEHSWNIIILFQ